MYDVIIVGARCAGASVAINLARAGHRVLLVDKTSFPKDTLSTHFVWPRGASYLNRLGVLDNVLKVTPSAKEIAFTIEGITLKGEVPLALLQDRFKQLHNDQDGVVQNYFSARRTILDKMLVETAVEAGAELREGFTVKELVTSQGRVIGIKGETSTGAIIEERCRVVIGADGVNSTVAKKTNTIDQEIRQSCTYASYSYFSGFNFGQAIIQKKGRVACGIVPTNDGMNMTLVFGPKEWYKQYRPDIEGNFFKTLNFINPELADQIQSTGKREEGFYNTDRQTAFIRKSAGLGYVLIGDAASFKDQCTAIGMTHAFRDAELAASYIKKGLTGELDLDVALDEYAHKRHIDSWRYYEFVCSQAEMNPLRADELQLFQALEKDQEQINRFISVYADTLPVKEFYTDKSVTTILTKTLSTAYDYEPYKIDLFKYYRNIYTEDEGLSNEEIALSRTCVDYAQPVGPNLITRIDDYQKWYSIRNEEETWQYSRTLQSFPGPYTKLVDDWDRSIDGINFASQDYLGLGAHPAIAQAAREALEEYGPHSAGSPMVIGNTEISRKLEAGLSDLLQLDHVMLFPTGWAAGFGPIVGLVRPQDHIIMDKLSHSCLYQGAYAATKNNVHRHPHLSVDAAHALLKEIRKKDKRNGILVISEGLFSMDSDSPDLYKLQEVCHEYNATLLVDVAHDLASLGPNGSGQIGIQKMLGKIDMVMGSFSKSFASNGGFLACNSPAVKQYVKMYGGSHMFSNAISPIQSAVALKSLEIIKSKEGDALRANLLNIVNLLRNEFTKKGIECLGIPSAIVPVPIGDEKVARIAHRLLRQKNIAAMILEYPVVATGASRFRLQVMATHTEEQAKVAVENIIAVIGEAKEYVADKFSITVN